MKPTNHRVSIVIAQLLLLLICFNCQPAFAQELQKDPYQGSPTERLAIRASKALQTLELYIGVFNRRMSALNTGIPSDRHIEYFDLPEDTLRRSEIEARASLLRVMDEAGSVADYAQRVLRMNRYRADYRLRNVLEENAQFLMWDNAPKEELHELQERIDFQGKELLLFDESINKLLIFADGLSDFTHHFASRESYEGVAQELARLNALFAEAKKSVVILRSQMSYLTKSPSISSSCADLLVDIHYVGTVH